MKHNNTIAAAQAVTYGWKYRAVLVEARAACREHKQYGPRKPTSMRSISLIRRRSGEQEYKVTYKIK